jgi:hypothetical protein
MSLQESPKTYTLGIIVSKSFDDPSWLEEKLGDKLDRIKHINTNGVNPLVMEFALENGIPFSVFPLKGGKSAPWSNARIVELSDVVYIIGTPGSKNARAAEAECVKEGRRCHVFECDTIAHWKEKVYKVAEILAATTVEDRANNTWMRAIDKAI